MIKKIIINSKVLKHEMAVRAFTEIENVVVKIIDRQLTFNGNHNPSLCLVEDENPKVLFEATYPRAKVIKLYNAVSSIEEQPIVLCFDEHNITLKELLF